VLLAVPTLPLNAQSREDRAALGAFRDSLTPLTDSAHLAALASQYEGVETGDSTEALASIRAGFVRLQAGMPALAEKDFRRAARLQPAWPVPWLGLGDAHAALGLATLENKLNLGAHPGMGEFQDAADAYGRSLEVDPRFAPGIEAELTLAVARRDTALLANAVAHAHRLPPEAATPSFLLALSRAEWRMGNVQAAQAALRAVPPDQATPSVQYERARALLAAGDAYGEYYYWSAVSADDPAMLLMLRRDLTLIATPEEMKAFDAVPPSSRVAFLHQFWGARDAAALRPPGERMREHYARIAYADRHYAFSDARHWHKPGDLLDAFPFDSMLDSRGVVYVRMGPPDVQLQPHVPGYVASETWEYNRVQDTLLLTFAAQNSIGDMVLIRTVDDIACQTSYGCDSNELYYQLQVVNETYRRLYTAGSAATARYQAKLYKMGKESITTSTTTDAHPLRFLVSLNAQVLPLAIGAAPGGSGVQVAVAVVHPAARRSGQRDTLRVRFAALGHGGTAVARLDTTLVYSAPFSPTSADTTYTMFAHIPTTLPAGTWTWQAAVQTGDSTGALLPSQRITIPVHDSSMLAVSDLAIGARGWSARWVVAPGDTAWVTPRHSHRAGVPVDLYYEVYGIPAGQQYRADITARRGDKGKGPSITLGLEEHSTGTPSRVSRTLDLSSLTPGDYILEVLITNAAGGTASSSRPLKIVNE